MGRDYLDFICMQHNKQRSEYLITPVDSSVLLLQNNYHLHEFNIIFEIFIGSELFRLLSDVFCVCKV